MQRGIPSIPCRLGHRYIMTYASHQAPAGVVQQPHHHQQQHAACKQHKTIYLIRHGEGFHNVGMDHNLDAHLTPRGWAQTAALNQHLQARQEQLGIQLVVVSPLRRTLETAAGVFGARAPPPAAAAAAASAAATTAAAATAGMHQQPGWTLMNEVSGRPAEVTAQTTLFLPPVVARRAVVAAAGAAAAAVAGAATLDAAIMGGDAHGGPTGAVSDSGAAAAHEPLKLLAYEGCRERIGPNVCDKFRDINLQAADFPGVDFSLMAHSTDVAWEALHDAACADGGCYLSGEEESHCEARALEFYAWLLDRPESVIAVVSHCGFLVHGMRALGKSMLKSWGDAMMLQLTANSSSITAAVSGALLPTANGFTVSPVPSALPSAQGMPFVPPGLSTTPQHTPSVQAGEQGFGAPALSQQVDAGGQVVSAAAAGQGGGGGLLHVAKAAEALRQAATDLTGWMSADWMNCECRSIQLAWGDPAELLSEQGVVAAAAAETKSDAADSMAATAGGRFLWARSGEASAWWPGGLHGIMQQLY